RAALRPAGSGSRPASPSMTATPPSSRERRADEAARGPGGAGPRALPLVRAVPARSARVAAVRGGPVVPAAGRGVPAAARPGPLPAGGRGVPGVLADQEPARSGALVAEQVAGVGE